MPDHKAPQTSAATLPHAIVATAAGAKIKLNAIMEGTGFDHNIAEIVWSFDDDDESTFIKIFHKINAGEPYTAILRNEFNVIFKNNRNNYCTKSFYWFLEGMPPPLRKNESKNKQQLRLFAEVAIEYNFISALAEILAVTHQQPKIFAETFYNDLLSNALMSDKYFCAEVLLQYGANVNGRYSDTNNNQFLIADFIRDPLALQFLLERGANPHVRLGKIPLLIHAVLNGEIAGVTLLIRASARIQSNEKHQVLKVIMECFYSWGYTHTIITGLEHFLQHNLAFFPENSNHASFPNAVPSMPSSQKDAYEESKPRAHSCKEWEGNLFRDYSQLYKLFECFAAAKKHGPAFEKIFNQPKDAKDAAASARYVVQKIAPPENLITKTKRLLTACRDGKVERKILGFIPYHITPNKDEVLAINKLLASIKDATDENLNEKLNEFKTDPLYDQTSVEGFKALLFWIQAQVLKVEWLKPLARVQIVQIARLVAAAAIADPTVGVSPAAASAGAAAAGADAGANTAPTAWAAARPTFTMPPARQNPMATIAGLPRLARVTDIAVAEVPAIPGQTFS